MFNKLFTIALLAAVLVDAKKGKKDKEESSDLDQEFLEWAA